MFDKDRVKKHFKPESQSTNPDQLSTPIQVRTTLHKGKYKGLNQEDLKRETARRETLSAWENSSSSLMAGFVKKGPAQQLRKPTKNKAVMQPQSSAKADIAPPRVEPMESKDEFLQRKLKEIRAKKLLEETITGTNTRLEEGFLYVIENPSCPGWFKIGQTTDYEARLISYQTYHPEKYSYMYIDYTVDRVQSEYTLIKQLTEYEMRNEWVRINLQELIVLLGP